MALQGFPDGGRTVPLGGIPNYGGTGMRQGANPMDYWRQLMQGNQQSGPAGIQAIANESSRRYFAGPQRTPQRDANILGNTSNYLNPNFMAPGYSTPDVDPVPTNPYNNGGRPRDSAVPFDPNGYDVDQGGLTAPVNPYNNGGRGPPPVPDMGNPYHNGGRPITTPPIHGPGGAANSPADDPRMMGRYVPQNTGGFLGSRFGGMFG